MAGIALGCAALAGCAWMAEATAPSKMAQAPSQQALDLLPAFWAGLHGGEYAQIDELIEAHAREVARAPGDALTLAHLGWLHAWRIAERVRAEPQGRSIEDAFIAHRLFNEAARLAPLDARYAGFAASFGMTEASILGDERALRRSYYRMREAVSMWPEFNLFTSGYTMSTGPVTGKAFQEGLQQQWETLDQCFGERLARAQPRLDAYLHLMTQQGPKRACWNSTIAPHNWEGFFLNFGDMLARSSDLANARTMYEAARLSPSYVRWPARQVLERRLERLTELPQRLNRTDMAAEPVWVTMAQSAIACTGCHQSSGQLPAAVLAALLR